MLERRILMPIEQRIRMSLLAKKMQEQKKYSEKLGLEDVSTFHGKRMNKKGGSKIC